MEKERFFAQYYGQDILTYKNENVIFHVRSNSHWYAWQIAQGWLELKPLSSISDEDAIEVINMFGYVNNFSDLHEHKKELFSIFSGDDMDEVISNSYHPTIYLKMYDFLRSKGYALLYLDITVEEQVKRGWIKLV